MAQSASIGEMNALVIVQRQVSGIDRDGYPTEEWKDLFPGPIWCKWVKAKAGYQEAYEHNRMGLQENVVLTTRYTPEIDQRCRVYKVGESIPYEVVGVDNVLSRRAWLEIRLKREVVA